MVELAVSVASASDVRRLRDWADEEGWNPGDSDPLAFFPADPGGFFFGRLNGQAVASVSAIRYGTDFGFIGFYIARPAVRGQGHGIVLWRRAMAHLVDRNIGLDGVVDQQDNYRRSGFRRAWNNVRYQGVPAGGTVSVTVVDARAVPFDQLVAYDRRFFPAPRESFLAGWVSLPGHTALAAVQGGALVGLGVLRLAGQVSRVGPLYAASEEVAQSLLTALSATRPGFPIAVDVPDINRTAITLVERLGLTPSFEAARMYTGPTPEIDQAGLYAVTTLELG
ncbi:GNAT family N-acetyltransferase [Actinokineospora sp. NBRC 105648]|uniref:GNAT family N-acetyltransferase n=1 Tax=Actinokineospora sp. NBRC 105648 TaxID=3032206 RepID=UPI0024A060DD|nr:GNAT family N-acetyltransferase [Actinokineospora sp. NBRC 105648]GLZ41086.1 N-acetyltransferase GCN5 [Actinokineospora sp. NBRC 105648]